MNYYKILILCNILRFELRTHMKIQVRNRNSSFYRENVKKHLYIFFFNIRQDTNKTENFQKNVSNTKRYDLYEFMRNYKYEHT